MARPKSSVGESGWWRLPPVENEAALLAEYEGLVGDCVRYWMNRVKSFLSLDELRHEVRLCALGAIRSYNDSRGAALKTWIISMTNWHLGHLLRGLASEQAHLGPSLDVPDSEDAGENWRDTLPSLMKSVEQLVETKVLCEQIIDCVDERAREALSLYFVRELPGDQVGAQMGLSARAGHYQVNRAIEQARVRLGITTDSEEETNA